MLTTPTSAPKSDKKKSTNQNLCITVIVLDQGVAELNQIFAGSIGSS